MQAQSAQARCVPKQHSAVAAVNMGGPVAMQQGTTVDKRERVYEQTLPAAFENCAVAIEIAHVAKALALSLYPSNSDQTLHQAARSQRTPYTGPF